MHKNITRAVLTLIVIIGCIYFIQASSNQLGPSAVSSVGEVNVAHAEVSK
ncbi:MAG: hypothetical protein KBD06_00465 [Candidatus Pacebacteria bacterium]|nr:hypothetical protein [Candidatus Paceibacterota bacterium]